VPEGNRRRYGSCSEIERCPHLRAERRGWSQTRCAASRSKRRCRCWSSATRRRAAHREEGTQFSDCQCREQRGCGCRRTQGVVVFVDEGMTMKRLRARAKGRAAIAFSSAAAISRLKSPTAKAEDEEDHMGQKVHPTASALASSRTTTRCWYADRGSYAEQLEHRPRGARHLSRRSSITPRSAAS
jgi:hypothetical protein